MQTPQSAGFAWSCASLRFVIVLTSLSSVNNCGPSGGCTRPGKGNASIRSSPERRGIISICIIPKVPKELNTSAAGETGEQEKQEKLGHTEKLKFFERQRGLLLNSRVRPLRGPVWDSGGLIFSPSGSTRLSEKGRTAESEEVPASVKTESYFLFTWKAPIPGYTAAAPSSSSMRRS